MAGTPVWLALTDIWIGQVRSFHQGDIVPDSVEARWDYSGQGLVARAVLDEDGATLGETGVAFLKDVVLRDQLWVGSTPPETPKVGTVWIDTSTAF